MLHPVGSHNPAIYWRRRLVLLATVIVLVVLTVWVLRPSGGGKGQAQGPAHQSTSAAADQSSTPAPSNSSPASTPNTKPASGTSSAIGHSGPVSTTPKASASSSSPPAACTPGQLKVSAVVGQPTYPVGADPVVMLQVIDQAAVPCIQNLADSQILLEVFNGASRVWGSHDCEIQPGTDERTLTPGAAVRVSVTWSGLTSQAACAGTRQRVGAGTYTLYAYLSGHVGSAAQFSIN